MASRPGKKRPAPKGLKPKRGGKPAVVKAPAPGTLSARGFAGLITSWVLVLLALFTLPNAKFVLPLWRPFPTTVFYFLLLAGFVGLVYFFRRLPENGMVEDLPTRVSRPLFFALLVLGAALRLHDINRISGCIDNDHWMCAHEALDIMEYGDRPILLPYGLREPFFAYLSAGVWSLIPQATANVALTLSSVLVDLFILWSFYLLGKEFCGRRGGLILMAMGTISKTLIQISKINFGFHTDVLACALTLLFLFRLLKNPKLSHFIQWGLAMALGSWIYVAFRLWTPAVIGFLWLWILWRPETRPKSRATWALAFGVMAGWVFAFAYVNQVVLSHSWSGVRFFAEGAGLPAIVLVLAALYLWAGWQTRGNDWTWKWATGALLTALLLSPLWAQPVYSDHANETVIFNPRYGLALAEAWRYLFATFWNGFRLMFSYDDTNPFWNIPPMHEDSYMDFFIPAFGAAALASFFAKPRLIQASVLGLFFIGYTSFFVTHGAHSNRLMAALLPMYLIAAWGAYRLWQAFRLSPVKKGGAWGTALLLLFGLWMLASNIQILKKWMDMRWPDTLSQDVMNTLPQDRIYTASTQGYFGESAIDLISEGRDAHQMLASNPIDLEEGEKGKDLAVIMAGGDTACQTKLSQAYPGGTWHEKSLDYPQIVLRWVVIPFAQITQNSKDLFYVEYKPGSFWWRRFYGNLGLGRGLMRYEDRQAHWNDADSLDYMGGGNTARVSGTLIAPKSGDYTFILQTLNTSQLWVDGREILEVKRPTGLFLKSVKLNLAVGKHEAEILTAFNQEHQIPQVLVRSDPEGWAEPLDDLAQDGGVSPAGP